MYKDFAHAPSKVKATSSALKAQFPRKKITVCVELHTYSSLDSKFIIQYANTLDAADEVMVFYDPEALKIKNRDAIPPETIKRAFDHPVLEVFTQTASLESNVVRKGLQRRGARNDEFWKFWRTELGSTSI